MPVSDEDGLRNRLGRRVTVAGTARDARLGAVVELSDGTPVYVADLNRWDARVRSGTVEVTGTLRSGSLAPDPDIDEDGAVSHGVEGDQYRIEDADWQVANRSQ